MIWEGPGGAKKVPDPVVPLVWQEKQLERAKVEACPHGKVLFPHLNFSLKL